MTVPRIRLRLANPGDRPLLEAWDREPAIIAATGDDGYIDWAYELPREVEWREYLIAEDATGRAIGMLAVIDPRTEETHYWGDIGPNLRAVDIWIGAPGDRARGLGSEMMRRMAERCFADAAVTAILIDPLASNARAIRFYERLGYERLERRTFGDDDCWVLRLTRARWQALGG